MKSTISVTIDHDLLNQWKETGGNLSEFFNNCLGIEFAKKIAAPRTPEQVKEDLMKRAEREAREEERTIKDEAFKKRIAEKLKVLDEK